MSHPDYDGELQCGCDCAGRMEEDYVSAQSREKTLRNKAGRRRSWTKLKGWHKSQKGNLTITKDGLRATVFRSGNAFKGSVTNLANQQTVYSKRQYPDEEKTKYALFDYIEALKDTAQQK